MPIKVPILNDLIRALSVGRERSRNHALDYYSGLKHIYPSIGTVVVMNVHLTGTGIEILAWYGRKNDFILISLI